MIKLLFIFNLIIILIIGSAHSREVGETEITTEGGIEVFQEILLQNGYLEFKEDQSYDINDNIFVMAKKKLLGTKILAYH